MNSTLKYSEMFTGTGKGTLILLGLHMIINAVHELL